MRTIATSRGPVPVWGRLEDQSRPLLFVVRGALPTVNHMLSLGARLKEVDVALVHLPGMHTPFFRECSVEAFAGAFDEVLEMLGYETVLIMGMSIGGVVALAMRSASIKRRLLVDTPLTTDGLWPLIPTFRASSANHSGGQAWFAGLFGIYPDRVEPRDYRPLLKLSPTPLTVLLGEQPLPDTPESVVPDTSLVSASDRAAYAARDHTSIEVIAGAGHNLAKANQTAFLAALAHFVDDQRQ